MKSKTICKIIIDFLMVVLLLLLMAFQLTGQFAHELIGASMFVLFITHNILNRNWYLSLLKGRYTPFRVLQTIINLLAFLSIICLMISGIIMSRYVFVFLPVTGGASFARTLHMLASYWGFVLMSLHLGLHWNTLTVMTRKALKQPSSLPQTVAFRMIAAVIALYGLYAFIKTRIWTYMLLLTQFVFFDYEQPAALFFADYLAMMGFFVFLAYYVAKLIQKHSTRKNSKDEA